MIEQALRRVVTYERVSSEDQKKRETIKTQTQEIARRLESDSNVVLVERFADEGVSGEVPFGERPAGRRLMAAATSRQFQEVWVYRIDRLGRDEVVSHVVWRDLLELGITVHSVTEGVSDPFMYSMHVALAAKERRDFLQRTGDGMNRAATEGRYTGGIVPLGYMVAGERPTARLVPSNKLMWNGLSEADIVRKIYNHLAIDGWSCRKIAIEFNALGTPTAYQKDGRGIRGQMTQGIWRPGRIRNLVVNTIYRGELQYGRRSTRPGGREVISAQVEPIVSELTWSAAQEALARNRIMPKNSKRVYMLRSLIRCGLCGLTYCGTMSNGFVWYRCGGQLVERGPIEGRCWSKSLKDEYIEPIVWSDIEKALRNPGELVEELELEASGEGHRAVAEAESVTLQARLSELETERRRAADLHIRGRLTTEELTEHDARIDTDREEITRRLDAIKPTQDDVEKPIDVDLLSAINSRLDEGLNEEERQEIARLLVRRITVYTELLDANKKGARVTVEYRIPNVVPTCNGTGSSPPGA